MQHNEFQWCNDMLHSLDYSRNLYKVQKLICVSMAGVQLLLLASGGGGNCEVWQAAGDPDLRGAYWQLLCPEVCPL